MPGLTAGFAAGVLWSQRVGPLQAIAGRWLAAIGAVFVESAFQLGDSGFEPGDARFKFIDDFAYHIYNGIDPALVKGGLDDRFEDFGSVFQGTVSAEYAANLLKLS